MSLTPYGLQCEHRVAPLGIDASTPLLTWKLAADERGRRQTAYRITVTSDGKSCWDSGWQDGEAPARGILYAGVALTAGTRYDWDVIVRDQNGSDSATVHSWFETGLLGRADWGAAWIRRDGRSVPPVDPPTDDDAAGEGLWTWPPARFRREFRLSFTPVRARAYVTAHGVYQLRINGSRVGRDELTPGWTDYRTRLQYQTYDVTDLLTAGANALGALVADGWWAGYIGFDPRHRAQHYGEYPELLASIRIDGRDGEKIVIGTDGEWKEKPGEICYADFLAGEKHDLRLLTPGWDRSGFDDAGWSSALTADADTSALIGTLDEAVRVTEEVAASEISRSPSGRLLVDFGQNLVGRVRMRIAGLPAGTTITLRHGETLDAGELYTANLRGAVATDEITVGESGEEFFEPRFTTHGFRYVELTGHPGEPAADDVTARVLHSDSESVGELHCSEEMVEQLLSNIRWGQRGNYVSVPTDCPQRDERLGWTADAQIFLPTACFNYDLAAFMSRWMLDLVAGQDDDGAFPDVAPRLLADREGAPAWGDAGTVVPYHLWQVYGDVRILQRSYPAMRAWVDHIERHNADLIWRHATGNSYGDWLQIDADTPRDVVATAYFARSASIVAATAEIVGETSDASRYGDLAARIRRAFTAEFVTSAGVIGGGTQTAHLMALAWKLIPGEVRPLTFEHLCRDLEGRGCRLTTGFVGVPLLCPVLSAGGRDDLAFGLLHQEAFPSWGYSIRNGATTIWERWDGWTEARGFQSTMMNSFNHYSLGSVGEWLWRSVAGIDQTADSVGFGALVIAPRLGERLDWVSGRYDSPRGVISVRWQRDGDGVRGDIEIPPGRHCELRLPARATADVTVDGQPAADVTGVTVLGVDAGIARLQVNPGQWNVASVHH